MSVLHQIGHDSINLTNEQNLSGYSGMICSPLNYSESRVVKHIAMAPANFTSIFDPQLYYPRSMRGQLRSWDYYPNDFETADQSNFQWWEALCQKIIMTSQRVGCQKVCSPCTVAKRVSPAYYKTFIDVENYLNERVPESELEVYQTAIIDYHSIAEQGEVETIASILSQTHSRCIYLIIQSDVEPRREFSDPNALFSIMKLVYLLKCSGIEIIVPFCSSDFLLWKYAGASIFASGKFFNLRRFTLSRFEEPTSGGGQLPYWFEPTLLAYVREGDLERLKKWNLIPPTSENPYAVEILQQIQETPGKPWLALSWKKYLYDFFDLDRKLNHPEQIKQYLIEAEQNWGRLEDSGFLMEESRNNGDWIRPWRIAISEFDNYSR